MSPFDVIIVSVMLLANGDMEIIERQQINLLVTCSAVICPQVPAPLIKKIYRAQDGKIVLHKTIEQRAVTKMAPQVTMEFPE